jgi:hypothetical protein
MSSGDRRVGFKCPAFDPSYLVTYSRIGGKETRLYFRIKKGLLVLSD